jgi:hypothetical protein
LLRLELWSKPLAGIFQSRRVLAHFRYERGVHLGMGVVEQLLN